MPRYPLIESGSATVDSTGVARVRLGPRRAFEKWFVEAVAVESSSALLPELREYRGTESDSALTGTSRAGDLDSGVNPNPIALMAGEDLIYRWSGATPGANCRVTIQGYRELP